MPDQSSIRPLTSKAVTYKALGGPERALRGSPYFLSLISALRRSDLRRKAQSESALG